VKFRHGEYDLVFTKADHPVTKGFPTLHFTDETYWSMQGDVSRINVLGNGVEEGEPRPQMWSFERGKGRVIGCVPGHYNWTFDDPLYRILVLRSICWTAKLTDVDRLSELATVGARVAP
jgi:type 1 glutamine amidotransferase